ncbi:MAG: putative DNA binding domain-containing protein [Firmicutes bacterium]|nr:putative DNA binding domain-containing protein [Bacillota bacterium]
MLVEELIDLIQKIQKFQCEFQTIEVKSANQGCPKLYDTISSFSNQDDGGIIVFGLSEADSFKAVGVYDAQDLQKRIKDQCNQMEPTVRPLCTVCEYENRTIVSAEIPGIDFAERPVFYRGQGRIRGSFIRVGEADEHMTEYEIYSYDAFRKRTHDDLRVVENASTDFFDQELLSKYILAVKDQRKNISANTTDNEILELMGVTKGGIPTIAGLMAFSQFPQASFPQLCITAVVVPGTSMGDLGPGGERFLANTRINGPIGEMLDVAVEFVRRNSRTSTVIDDEGHRRDKEEFPIVAVREAILNALVHRDYSSHTETVPVRIVMFTDRMEIINSGGLYGRISIDSLGKVHPDTRNPTLANILELLHITENRYSGIPTIIKEFRMAKLPAPIFSNNRGQFSVVFRNNYYVNDQHDAVARTFAILDFCQIPRSRDELVDFLGFSQYYTMSKIIKPLLVNGSLKMTLPDKPKSHQQRYVTVKK